MKEWCPKCQDYKPVHKETYTGVKGKYTVVQCAVCCIVLRREDPIKEKSNE